MSRDKLNLEVEDAANRCDSRTVYRIMKELAGTYSSKQHLNSEAQTNSRIRTAPPSKDEIVAAISAIKNNKAVNAIKIPQIFYKQRPRHQENCFNRS